jgi:hypothetical protein
VRKIIFSLGLGSLIIFIFINYIGFDIGINLFKLDKKLDEKNVSELISSKSNEIQGGLLSIEGKNSEKYPNVLLPTSKDMKIIPIDLSKISSLSELEHEFRNQSIDELNLSSDENMKEIENLAQKINQQKSTEEENKYFALLNRKQFILKKLIMDHILDDKEDLHESRN